MRRGVTEVGPEVPCGRGAEQMARAKVAVLKTHPETVVEDYKKLMRMADYDKFLAMDKKIALKINVSWQLFYPGCSTTPWQLEGVIQTLLEDGVPKENIYGCHNRTVVVDGKIGEVNNKQKQIVVGKHGLENVHLQPEKLSEFQQLIQRGEWIRYEPKGEMLTLNDVFPDGIFIPKRFLDENMLHLPTVKTHVFTTMTGAMKNAFGALLHHERHWAHATIHETLVDLLTIQKEIFSGLFAVMDGTFVGDGAGPRAMIPYEKDLILASADMVAIDAVSAHMMGFDPLSLDFIRLAHERGLGCGDFREIEIVGEDISKVNWQFRSTDNFASRGQKMIYHGLLKPFEKMLLRTPIVPWSYLASRTYYDGIWYPFVGKKRVKQMMGTKWGRLFQEMG
jgi:uncharacterized protein (DUF362 family)